ncbi:unnamed protein product [Parascedosporium putredinis]|uniref:Cation-transporting P-type ATPase C-terminal domain-containing protein n=1 Tax=Parascedosporium putredinis TaxID=1442378 RepID=A0A9P1MBA7_9PEZI|nr:unnamed protein product [Parascedosporium putredinis]CAI7999246.1 unnamed protein product [Parascedosporium putredinis]
MVLVREIQTTVPFLDTYANMEMGGVVTFVIILNVVIGFWQEYRAEKRMDSLRALSSPSATVLRDGNTAVIPKVLTITMVVAVSVMSKANVVVRDLSALEALGGVTNIWKVTYQNIKEEVDVEESPKRDYDQERSAAALTFDVPAEKLNLKRPDPSSSDVEAEVTPALRALLLSSALCNLATVRYDETTSRWQTTGEPTEIALQVFAHRFDLGKGASFYRRMSVIYDPPSSVIDLFGEGNSIVFCKGAVERILELCSFAGFGEDRHALTEDSLQIVMEQTTKLASQGQRVLAIAYREWEGKFTLRQSPESDAADAPLRREVENHLTLLGLVGIYDPPCRETKPSIAECSSAGIRVHMLTGDHPETAKAIAKEVGIIPKNLSTLPAATASSIVQIATNFDKMTDEEIDALDELPLVIARCAPNTKTRMIEALRRRNAFMAMTGDGVNDAPSLSRADVGIAMGSGSDVAKSASKIVLADDKFNSIVAGIREGRRMFDNIQKFVLHLLSSNVGEVILLVAGLAFRDRAGYSVFPISPLEILWINMITSSFPAFGLGREAAARNVMSKPPHDKNRGVFTNQILVDMVVYGVMMGALTMATFVIVIYGAHGGDLGQDCNRHYSDMCHGVFRARAAVFAELTWLILVSAWEFKDLRRSLFRLHPNDDP